MNGLRTSAMSRQNLLNLRKTARAKALESEGAELIEKRSRAPIGTVTIQNTKLAGASAKYLARSASMAPQLVEDCELLLAKINRARELALKFEGADPQLREICEVLGAAEGGTAHRVEHTQSMDSASADNMPAPTKPKRAALKLWR